MGEVGQSPENVALDGVREMTTWQRGERPRLRQRTSPPDEVAP